VQHRERIKPRTEIIFVTWIRDFLAVRCKSAKSKEVDDHHEARRRLQKELDILTLVKNMRLLRSTLKLLFTTRERALMQMQDNLGVVRAKLADATLP
jgi:hypothetical protein